MTIQLSALSDRFVESINGGDAATFISLFSNDATVDDAGREFHGLDEIKNWSDREIFAVQVSVEVIDEAQDDGTTVLTTKVDGNFDKTGLPDPVIITQRIAANQEKIVKLTCKLVT